MRMHPTALSLLWLAGTAASLNAQTIHQVATSQALREALAAAKPGHTIAIAPGTYPGGLSASNLWGTPERPITIQAADPDQPPLLAGQSSGLQLSDVAHITLRHLIIQGATGNGLNIDDGGSYDTPSHHVRLDHLQIRDIGPSGNSDGLKLSGVDDFEVRDCTIERWGDRGSGIDMVGCHRGLIVGCTFRHGDATGDNGVQTKGGTSEIMIARCRFEHAGQRGVNIGGSTGLAFFRPRPQGYEARDITVRDCVFIGCQAPVAFVGVDGATVSHNILYQPAKWFFRILQETREVGFVPCRNGVFSDNVIAYEHASMGRPMINIGDGTDPASFRIMRNAWYAIDNPAASQPDLPLPQVGAVFGKNPEFVDPARGNLTLPPSSPVLPAGPSPAEPR